MTTQQIAGFLNSPHLINEQDLPTLEKSIETYPYVGLFHMLYLKGLHNTKSIYFDKALKTAALVINDRVKLHEMLYAPILIVSTDTIAEEKEAIVITEVADDPKLVTYIHSETAEISIETEPEIDVEMQQLQKNIVTEAIDHSLQVDINSLISNEVIESKEELIINETEIKEITQDPKSFGDWLNVMLPSNQETEKVSDKNSPLKSSKDLIDQFIATANKRIKVADNTPESIESAVKSLEDKNDFATETLAQVYASQKKYNRAIEIYELLALKFPEKKTFFASRIRFLREKKEYDN
jgi:hypothetical protein